ncbi:MAG: 2-phosphosulfolactate phosphatase [Tepidiformaceae bacterium]
MPRRLDLALLPAEALAIDADCYVIIDVLRATTTIATLFAGGLEELAVTGTIEGARELARVDDRLLLGEVGGVRPEGFDNGNSPVEAACADVRGRKAALFTTNGTAALCALAGRGDVYAGAIANASAVAGRLARYRRSVFVCAGTEGGARFALEDFAAAAVMIQRAVRIVPGLELGDAAGLAMTSTGYEDWLAPGLPQQPGRSSRLLSGSRNGRALTALGFGADIHFAMREDTSRALPMVVSCGPGVAVLQDAALD